MDKLLGQGYNVIGIDRFTDYYPRAIKEVNISNALRDNKFEFIEADILKRDEFPAVDFVFHEAAQAGVRASWGKSFEIYTRNNIAATQKMLEFYKDLGTCSQTSLNKAIGKPPSTIQYHLNTLKQAGLLVTKGKPPTTKYYIKREEDIGELKKIPR